MEWLRNGWHGRPRYMRRHTIGILRMRSAKCDYCAERIRRCAPVGFGCSDFVQQLQACRHRTTAVEYTHARMHACTGRRRLSARTLSASAHRSAAACAASCRAPRCCAASRRRAMTAHSQQGPIRHAHAASARQRAESCATASRAHACVCAPAAVRGVRARRSTVKGAKRHRDVRSRAVHVASSAL